MVPVGWMQGRQETLFAGQTGVFGRKGDILGKRALATLQAEKQHRPIGM